MRPVTRGSPTRRGHPAGYGYLGAGWTNTTGRPIAGTGDADDEALYQSQREATSGYRFDNLPAGTYRVELDVAEFRRNLAPGRRVFDVSINGRQLLTGYDPVAAVGALTLDHREFTVTVGAGGAIAIDFGARRGKLPPIVTAVRVTTDRISWQVDGSQPRGFFAARTAKLRIRR